MQQWMKWRGTGWDLIKKETTINHWCGNAGGIPTFMLAAAIIFTICKNNCDGLRDRVILRVDDGMRTGRDIAIAAMMGAEEFVMARLDMSAAEAAAVVD